MKKRFCKHLSVKSIVIILITLVFCYLSLTKVIPYDSFISAIIAFYFGTQHEKHTDSK